ncbi:MAG: hypothetical protein IKL72_05120, partial [Firmicutes bacterium]|nr:hypothetical protein [Bacillota bacterium]
YGDSVLCFCETYSDGTPDETTWKYAQNIAHFLKNKYSLPLDIVKDDAFLESMHSRRSSLDSQIQSASEVVRKTESPDNPQVKSFETER